MRKLVFLICVVLLAAVPAMAQDATAEATPWVCPDGFSGQTLNVYNWTTYVAEDTIPNFEAACGVTVVYDTYESNEAMLARLSGGNPGYDIVVPTDYMVAQMVSRDLLEPLDHASIPNLANVSPGLLDQGYDPGNMYSVPYQWGTVGIGYNKDKTGGDITSWQQVFSHSGPVAWLDDQRAMLGNALNILGYDPNSTDPAQIDEAKMFLINNGGNVVSIAGDDGQAQLERGDVDITVEYNGDILQVIADCGCDNIAYVIPEEGTNLWVDNLAIPKDAPNKPLAEAFIDYILDPQVGASISNYTSYGSPNQASIDMALIDSALLDNPAIYPSDETRAHLFSITPIPEAEQLYNDAWDEIKIALGQ